MQKTLTMKKIAYIIIFFVSVVSYAQNTNDVRFNLLIDELKYVRDSLHASIIDLSVTGDFRWLITYGKNSYSYLGVPGRLQKRLEAISQTDEIILSACLVQDSGWIVQTNKEKFYFKDIPPGVPQALELLSRKRATVNFVRVWPDSFIIFYNNYKFVSEGITRNLYRSLNTLTRKGKLIKDVEIWGQTYIILFGHKGILGYNLPSVVKENLYRIQQNAQSIDLVRRLPNSKWLVIYNGNQFLVI